MYSVCKLSLCRLNKSHKGSVVSKKEEAHPVSCVPRSVMCTMGSYDFLLCQRYDVSGMLPYQFKPVCQTPY